MRLGKTWTEAVALWKLAKAGNLGKKGTTKTITKTVVKKVKSKPQIKYRTRVIKSKPEIKYRTRTVVKKVASKPVKRTYTKVVHSSPSIDVSQLTKAFESSMSTHSLSKRDLKEAFSTGEEEIAFKIIQTYFIEIARQGFKRQLTLDEIINAYFYALAMVRSKKN